MNKSEKSALHSNDVDAATGGNFAATNKPVNPEVSRYLLRYLPREGLILDAGSGPLAYASFLRRYVNRIIAIDLSVLDADEARKNDFALATVESLPFKDSAFDSIYSLSVLQYCESDSGAMNEFHRVLEPGGRLLITVPTSRSIFRLLRDLELRLGIYKYPEFNTLHHHYYTRRRIQELITGRFNIVDMRVYGYDFVPRLRGSLVTVAKSNGVIRQVWRRSPKGKNSPPGRTLLERELGEETNNQSSKLGKLIKYVEGKFRFVSDLSYHYVVVLEKPYHMPSGPT